VRTKKRPGVLPGALSWPRLTAIRIYFRHTRQMT
jgi:hypothetical protein